MLYKKFTNEPRFLWSYWTSHGIFTWYRGIIYAVNAHIEVAISHSVSECQSNNCRGLGNFATKLVAMTTSNIYPKKKVALIICNSIPTIWCKDCENRSSESWDTSALNEKVRYVTILVAMATSLEESEKLDRENSCKYVPFGEKIMKIGPVDTEIALLIVKKDVKNQKKKLRKVKYIAWSASLPSGLKNIVVDLFRSLLCL